MNVLDVVMPNMNITVKSNKGWNRQSCLQRIKV